MKLYGGIDLHSNNRVVALLDEQDRVVYQKRLGNDLEYVQEQLAPYRADVQGLVVESTFNWYWLVDGLQAAGYRVHLANTAAIQQYAGLKYSDDGHDARWLAHLLRLGLLPEGYIYPKEERAVRDLLRKRSQLMRSRTSQVLSIENLVARNIGLALNGNEVKRLTLEAVQKLLPDPRLALAVASSLVVVQTLNDLIGLLERQVLEAVRLAPAFQPLLSIPGVGRVLALTIVASDRRYPPLPRGREFCLLLPLCGERAAEQRQAQGPG